MKFEKEIESNYGVLELLLYGSGSQKVGHFALQKFDKYPIQDHIQNWPSLDLKKKSLLNHSNCQKEKKQIKVV